MRQALEVTDIDKNSSLLRHGTNYGREMCPSKGQRGELSIAGLTRSKKFCFRNQNQIAQSNAIQTILRFVFLPGC